MFNFLVYKNQNVILIYITINYLILSYYFPIELLYSPIKTKSY